MLIVCDFSVQLSLLIVVHLNFGPRNRPAARFSDFEFGAEIYLTAYMYLNSGSSGFFLQKEVNCDFIAFEVSLALVANITFSTYTRVLGTVLFLNNLNDENVRKDCSK